jgi:hypothetical protein
VATQAEPQPQDEMAQQEAPERQQTQQQATPIIDVIVGETEKRIRVESDMFAHNQRLARMFCASGYFADIKGTSPEQGIAQAMVKIELGRAIGLTPAQSMQSIYIVNGRPALDSQIRAARMKLLGYEWRFTQMDDHGCIMDISRGGEHLGSIGFTEADAKKADLLNKAGGMYTKWASDMYFARAVTRAQRRFAPEALQSLDILDRFEADDVPPPERVESEMAGAATAIKAAELRRKLEAARVPETNKEP